MNAFRTRSKKGDRNGDQRNYIRRFPSDSDLYRKVLHKKAMSHANLHKKFASCTQLNKLPSFQQHQNCKEYKYEEKLTSELNRFYSRRVRKTRAQVKRNKQLAFSLAFKSAFISFFIHSTPFFFFELSKRISPHYKKAEEKKTLSNHPS